MSSKSDFPAEDEEEEEEPAAEGEEQDADRIPKDETNPPRKSLRAYVLNVPHISMRACLYKCTCLRFFWGGFMFSVGIPRHFNQTKKCLGLRRTLGPTST